MRVTNRVASRNRRRRILARTKGQVGGRRRLIRTASEIVVRGDAYAYVGRKQKKRQFRRLWITRVSAAVKLHGLNYSQFMNGIKKSGVDLNRKQLSEMAIHDPDGFTALTEKVKAALTG
jgi:large subunit ribosomal protein L20